MTERENTAANDRGTISNAVAQWTTRARIMGCCLMLLIGTLADSVGGIPQRRGVLPHQLSSSTTRRFALSNKQVTATWRIEGGRFHAAGLEDHVNGRSIPVPENAFSLILKDGTTLSANEMRVVDTPVLEVVRGNPKASRLAERVGGRQLRLTLEDNRAQVRVLWCGLLPNGANYVRQELTIEALARELPVSEIRLIDMRLAGARVSGSVNGSPIVANNIFLGFEHPLSVSKVESDRLIAMLPRELPLRVGSKVTYSSVIGVTSPGQLRRDFLTYVELERAHPYRPFLHYNSWYDIGYTNKFNEADSLDVIERYGQELVRKRGVVLSSFLFDDGWDDTSTLWGFHSGFPHGFTSLKDAAAKYGAAPGVWMSPWGGYDAAKEARLKFGIKAGFEISEGGFALSGPKYYERFREVSMEMLHRYGVNQFKIDGMGNANRAIPGSKFDSDFDAAISLVRELREQKPDLYINLTVGTYPSPFWLRYGDSIWRGGEDHAFTGVGSDRQQWITYRDAQTYKMTVQRGPLYPLNSLMTHGLIYAKRTKRLKSDPQNDFPSEIKSYFGSGTQLQEMYVTPSLLTRQNWDLLAEAALWSHRNADIFVDTHWVGGDPGRLEVYGWASWKPRKGILVLRNPSDNAQTISLDPRHIFELSPGAPTRYTARSPWRDEKGQPAIELRAGTPHAFTLKPFEVVTLEALPRRQPVSQTVKPNSRVVTSRL